MQPIEQLMKILEGQKQNMQHFVEHMEVILNNFEDNLTKELLSHLIEGVPSLAIKEDDLIFNGNQQFRIEGLTNATGRLTHLIGD